MSIKKHVTAIFASAALAFGALIMGVITPAPALAQDAKPAPIVIYDDALLNGWQNWSWAKVEMQVPAGSVKPIKVEGDPWTALAFHHDPFSTKGYTKLTFFINGGVDGGQAIAIKVLVDGKAVESNYVIAPKTKQWLPVEVLLKDIGGQDVMVDGVWFQGQADAYKPYYITKIQFE